MSVDHALILRVLPVFKDRLLVRHQKDGFGWYERKEVRDMGLDRENSAQVVMRVSRELPFELDQRGDGEGENLQTLIELYRMSNGETTDEVSRLFCEKTGKPKIAGPFATAARKRLGMVKPKDESTPKHVEPQVPSELAEALRMIRDAEKAQSRVHAIEDQIATLEIELKKAKEDATVYAGVLGSLRAVTSAVQTAKSKIAQNATVKT